MSVTTVSLSRTLSSVFNTVFVCREEDAFLESFSIRPEFLSSSEGFSVSVYRPYKNSCKATLKPGNFSRTLLERWFELDGGIEGAFEFVESISKDLSLEVKVAGKRVFSAEEFSAEGSSDWPSKGISVRFAYRDIDEKEADYCFYLTAMAAMGFGLFASGLVREEGSGDLEGCRVETRSSRYERSPINRARCIALHGARCAVCGFDFGETYGSFASGFIEVHHKTPLSSLDVPVEIDPATDLVPLCPNCHAAAHIKNPPISPEVLKECISQNVINDEIS